MTRELGEPRLHKTGLTLSEGEREGGKERGDGPKRGREREGGKRGREGGRSESLR